MAGPNNKTVLCSTFLEGYCCSRQVCPYAHGIDELRGPHKAVLMYGKRSGQASLDALAREGITSMPKLVDKVIVWSRNGSASAPPGIVAVLLADLYGYCSQKLEKLYLDIEKATQPCKGCLVACNGQHSPSWVGYYSNPSEAKSGREYIHASDAVWTYLSSINAASLTQIISLVLSVYTAADMAEHHPPSGYVAVYMRDLKNWCREHGRGVWINTDQAVEAGFLRRGGDWPDEWIGYRINQTAEGLKRSHVKTDAAMLGTTLMGARPPATSWQNALTSGAPSTADLDQTGASVIKSSGQHSTLALAKDKESWGDLADDERDAASLLGWNENDWNSGLSPKVGSRWWAKLSQAEINAAGALGYDSMSWDHELCNGAAKHCEEVQPLPIQIKRQEVVTDLQHSIVDTKASGSEDGPFNYPDSSKLLALRQLTWAIEADMTEQTSKMDALNVQVAQYKAHDHAQRQVNWEQQQTIEKLQHQLGKCQVELEYLQVELQQLRGEPKAIEPLSSEKLEQLLRQLQRATLGIQDTQAKARAREMLCSICLEEMRAIVFVPCGHQILCSACAELTSTCPSCSATIVQKIHARN
mmetsp:Transcript_26231/g.43461  ORF Transcript_26231/g.43461 Transcript_26231/m.43461 type:complete len:585 (-) Transcript_26231:179-1933(-)|eukprot:CAMPEP_0119349872 /NCGR_PEP_ID=MMETSP1333-20130426/109770_1 /TAXON_ID=418940 /ORGANISM="Scyphosphaera apsteinii, Strain RCC1455" /LENGTH=584 /DNA_ID=CAMNT_0007362475 /DNA_START=32 /DNA_END=1786 /DNA_ORIENTATION=+